jgi:SAM-dependent methyltransferase
VQADVVDLEAGEVDLGREAYDLIVVVHYLHRPLFPALLRALAPGGYVLYETFTVDQARRGRPSNPDFLLRHGELRERLAPLAILRERDGPVEGRDVASVMARKA